MSIRAVSGAFQTKDYLSNRARPELPASSEPMVENAANRALVPVKPAGQTADVSRRHYRPAAPFVAQLIATFEGLPQTRKRGRASSDDAATAYRNVQSAVGRTDLSGQIDLTRRSA
jgi:hypothetical protein